MKLADYLKAHDLKASDFAGAIEVTPQAVHRYLTGDRMPRPEVLRAIHEATKGAVTANDFVGLEEAS